MSPPSPAEARYWCQNPSQTDCQRRGPQVGRIPSTLRLRLRVVPSRWLPEVPCHHFWPGGLSLFQLQTSLGLLFPRQPLPLHPSPRRRLTTMSPKSSLRWVSVSRGARLAKENDLAAKKKNFKAKDEEET